MDPSWINRGTMDPSWTHHGSIYRIHHRLLLVPHIHHASRYHRALVFPSWIHHGPIAFPSRCVRTNLRDTLHYSFEVFSFRFTRFHWFLPNASIYPRLQTNGLPKRFIKCTTTVFHMNCLIFALIEISYLPLFSSKTRLENCESTWLDVYSARLFRFHHHCKLLLISD